MHGWDEYAVAGLQISDWSSEDMLRKGVSVTSLARITSTRVAVACADGAMRCTFQCCWCSVVSLFTALHAGAVRVWQSMGDGLPGNILAAPDTDTFDETRTKALLFIAAYTPDVINIAQSHASGPTTHSQSRIVTVNADGDVAVWSVTSSGLIATKSGPLQRLSLGSDVKQVSFNRSTCQLCVLAGSGKAAFIVSVGR